MRSVKHLKLLIITDKELVKTHFKLNRNSSSSFIYGSIASPPPPPHKSMPPINLILMSGAVRRGA